MTHKAVVDGADRYNRLRYFIARNFQTKYLAGTMKMRSLYDDEKTKMQYVTTCCYCGVKTTQCRDHLIPHLRVGPDDPISVFQNQSVVARCTRPHQAATWSTYQSCSLSGISGSPGKPPTP